MSAVADGVGRAVCALTGAWRGERSGEGRETAERRGARAQGRERAQRETASPMVLHCVVGE